MTVKYGNSSERKILFASILGWIYDLIVTVITIGVLLGLGFEVQVSGGALPTAIFAVIIASTGTFFIAFSSNPNLILAIRNAGYFPKMLSYFAIPILSSLVGLLFSVFAVFLTSPSWIESTMLPMIGEYILLFLIVYSIYGFLGTVSYSLFILSLTALADGENV